MSTLTNTAIGAAGSAGMIHPAIIAIMRAVGPIAKSQKNNAQGFNYRGIDQVYNEVHPHFAEQGVYSTSEILDAKHLEGKSEKGKAYVHSILKMRFTFWAADGSKVISEVIGEGIDFGGDKASNKAMSVADKYAILQLLKIPTAMVDPDLPAGEESKANGKGSATADKPAAPKKSAMELMQEAAAAESAAASASVKDEKPAAAASATVVDPPAAVSTGTSLADSPGTVTAEQRAKIEELFEKVNYTAEQRQLCFTKRGCNSIRNLSQLQAHGLIDGLNGKLTAMLAAGTPATTTGSAVAAKSESPLPSTDEQAEKIKKLLAEGAQSDPTLIQRIGKMLAAAGLQKVSQMCRQDCDRLILGLQKKQMADFFDKSLADWKPPVKSVTPAANGAATTEAANPPKAAA